MDDLDRILRKAEINSPQAKQIKMRVIQVTPDLAEDFLSRNLPVNRDMRKRALTSYVHDMLAKEWRLTGDPIIFNEDGHLIDGQHRCQGCVNSKVPFETVVITGVTRSAIEAIGNVEGRTLVDMLHMQGEENARVLSGAVTLLNAHLNGAFIKGRVDRLTPAGQRALLEQHPGLRSSVLFTDQPNIKQHLDHKVAAAFHYIAQRADSTTTSGFFDRLSGKLPCGFGDPEFAFAERCRHALRGGTAKLSRPEKRGILVKAFAIRQSGKDIQQLKFDPDKARKWPIIKGDKLNGILAPQES